MPDGAEESAYLSPPVQRAARLLRRIAEGDAVTNMSRTARELDISRTTLLRLLHTLEAERLIERRGEEGAGWRIGTALISLASRAVGSDDLAQLAAPVLGRLAERLGLSTHLGVLDGREVVFLLRRTPNLSFASNIRVGSRLPAHAANMGRIILAQLPEEAVRRLYAGVRLERATDHTPATLPELLARLAADRAEGLAWSIGHFEPGIASVAAVLRDATGGPVAAINASGQVAGFEAPEGRARIGAAIREAAAEISARLGWAEAARQVALEGAA